MIYPENVALKMNNAYFHSKIVSSIRTDGKKRLVSLPNLCVRALSHLVRHDIRKKVPQEELLNANSGTLCMPML